MTFLAPERLRTLTSSARGPALGLGGQVLNAGTNVVTVYLASLTLSPSQFGEFAIAFACVTVVLAGARGLIGSTMLVHLPTVGQHDRARLERSAFGFTVLVGCGASALLVVVALVAPNQVLLLWFAPWMATVLLQDAARHALLSRSRPGSALLLDVAWATAQAAVLLGVMAAGRDLQLDVLATAWGVGGLAGWMFAMAFRDARAGDPRPWLHSTRDLSGWLSGVAVLAQVELYVVLLLTAELVGDADAGGLRAVQLLAYQPAMIMLGALLILATPVMVRARTSAVSVREASRRVDVMVAPVVGALVLVMLLRDPLMALFFSQYGAYAQLAVPVSLQGICTAFAVAPMALLQGSRRGSAVLALQSARAVSTVVAAVVGVLVAGVAGLAWAMALSAVVTMVLTRIVAHRSVARFAGPTT